MKNAKIKEVPVFSVCVRKKLTLLTDTVTTVFKSRRDGLTLIELVIGMVLIGIVALVVANALSTGITGFFVIDNRKEALDQARIAMDRMAKEMRNVRSSSATDLSVANATTFTFLDTSGTSISFALSGGNINRTSGSTNTLATGISNGTFSSGIFTYVLSDLTETQTPTAAQMLTIKRIKIDFKATAGTENITLQTEVWPRNL
jgi:prepilin-type N-terminal cleavage/methylation domain-containing protein